MGSFFKSVGFWIKNIFFSLLISMRNTESEVLTSKGADKDSGNNGIDERVTDRSVAKALLRGEVTQEVKELRYRLYQVDREADKLEYYSPYLALKKEPTPPKNIYNPQGLDVVLIQDNTIQNGGFVGEDIEYNEDTEKMRISRKEKFSLSVKRHITTRLKLENYAYKCVVRKVEEDSKSYYTDIYVSKYNNLLGKEIARNNPPKKDADYLEIDSISFVTRKAYNQEDLKEFDIKVLGLIDVVEYDGSFIITYLSDITKDGRDILDDYYCVEMAEKYKNKAPKEERIMSILDVPEVKEYECHDCGKKMKYDVLAIASKEVTREEESETEEDSVLEGYDAQIAMDTFGFPLCKKCIAKRLDSLYQEIGKKQK